MKIRLTRLSNDRHRLTIERDGRDPVATELETRSVLLHDLVHYAVEAEAGIADGFYGLLAAGVDFAELAAEAEAPSRPGIALAESLVGPMQAVWNGRLAAERYVEVVRPVAPFVDLPFVERVSERIRRLQGHWRGTAFHAAMELTWPPT